MFSLYMSVRNYITYACKCSKYFIMQNILKIFMPKRKLLPADFREKLTVFGV
jgi:hypothetical protein